MGTLLLADSWWGFAEADPTIVGIVVAAVGSLAALYLVVRIFGLHRRGRGE